MMLFFLNVLRYFIKVDKNLTLFSSFPDLSDNSFALFCYKLSIDHNNRNIWLVDEIKFKEKYIKLISNYSSSRNYLIVKKNSLRGLYYFCKAKYIFHTHGIFNAASLSKKQININLWHGMPLKNIGYLDNSKNCQKSNYIIATSILFQAIMSKAFDIKKDNVFITGQPRNDFLFSNKYHLNNIVNIPVGSFKKTILWMPTYRQSKIGDIRKDGTIKKMTDFLSNESLKKVNKFLVKIEAVCIVKLHPMDYMNVEDFSKYSNIYFIDNSSFLDKGISLYSVLNSADILLTDFSSIYIDYLLLNKPIGFLFSDFEEYFNSRGFVFKNPKYYMPGEIINSIDELVFFLEKILDKKQDDFVERRVQINKIFNEQEADFSNKLYKSIYQTKLF